jgi:membrane protease subunit HflK
MSWHEPGRDRDPWRDPKEGPPDLDEWLRRARLRLRGWFGSRGPRPSGARVSLWAIVPIILIGVWLATGFYQVPADHKAATLRFGAYTGLSGPGLHWHWPWPIASDRLVNLGEGRSLSQQAEVLTHDGKLLDVGLTVSYRISNPYRYLFRSRHPTRIITALANSALASAARREDFAALRSGNLAALEGRLKQSVSAALAAANSGVSVQSVAVNRIALPDSVQSRKQALADLKKANTEKAKKARAHAKREQIAAGKKAAQLIAAAESDAHGRVALARQRAAHFKALLSAWRQSPDVARDTLRANVLAETLGRVPKVLVSGSVHSVTLPSLSASAPAPASVPAAASAGGAP